MSRPTLGDTVTVSKKFKLPAALSDEFAGRCDDLGITQSDQLRTLVERWLRQTAEIARLKVKSVGGKTA